MILATFLATNCCTLLPEMPGLMIAMPISAVDTCYEQGSVATTDLKVSGSSPFGRATDKPCLSRKFSNFLDQVS